MSQHMEYAVVHKNIIAKILFAYYTAKFTYRKNFHVYGIVLLKNIVRSDDAFIGVHGKEL